MERCETEGKPIVDCDTLSTAISDKIGCKTFHTWFSSMYDKPFRKQWIEKMFADNEKITLKFKEISSGLPQRDQLLNYSMNDNRRPEVVEKQIPTIYDKAMILLIKSSWETEPRDRPTAKDIVEHLKKMVSDEDEYNIQHLKKNY